MSYDIANLLEPTTTTSAPVDDRASAFVAVDGGEHYSGSTLLVSAYIAIWVILMAWIFLMWRKQASLAERLDDLERALDRAASDAEKTSK